MIIIYLNRITIFYRKSYAARFIAHIQILCGIIEGSFPPMICEFFSTVVPQTSRIKFEIRFDRFHNSVGMFTNSLPCTFFRQRKFSIRTEYTTVMTILKRQTHLLSNHIFPINFYQNS